MTHSHTADQPSAPTVKPRERDAILMSLRTGVVPRTGHQHIQVGRVNEVTALVSDLDRITGGGAGSRFVIGDFGAGKTFFLSVVRAIATQRKLVTVHADLSPDRRLHATGGQARSLYAELMRNMATRAKPDGGALNGVVERFVTQARTEATAAGTNPDDIIRAKLAKLTEMTGGYDFAEVIAAYWRGYDSGNDQLQADAVRWLRGEFGTKTEARTALGVRTIVDDSNFYDQLKLMAKFTMMAGYGGLLVCLDEMVNLYKLASTQARNGNYEQILRMLNDSVQGSAAHIGFVFGGTPEFLMDTRRGLYSYPALQSRLAENTFAGNGLSDYTGPVLRLANLSQEDFYILLSKLLAVHASGLPTGPVLPEEGVLAFMAHCNDRVGDAYFRTPRTTIKSFLDLLAVLEQHPDQTWQNLVGDVELEADVNPDLAPLPAEHPPAGGASPAAAGAPPDGPTCREDDDDLTTFRL
jgi:hypothetical protein